jgi:hypothetical protein
MRVRRRVLFSQTGSVGGKRASPAMPVNAELERPPSPEEGETPIPEESEPKATIFGWAIPPCKLAPLSRLAGRLKSEEAG